MIRTHYEQTIRQFVYVSKNMPGTFSLLEWRQLTTDDRETICRCIAEDGNVAPGIVAQCLDNIGITVHTEPSA